MKDKYDTTNRERKTIRQRKNNSKDNMYSSKHIRNYQELLEWKKRNNHSKGGKSRHIKSD